MIRVPILDSIKMDSMERTYKSELSMGNKLARLLWGLVAATLFRWSPRPCHHWRVLCLRCFGATIDSSAKVYGTARIWAPWNLTMDAGSILGDRVDCYSVAPIRIGARAVVSQDAALCAATHDHRSEDFTLIPKPITVETCAWVAARAFVGPGVTVGEGSVVGACAVVFKDVPPQMIATGNPAVLHKK